MRSRSVSDAVLSCTLDLPAAPAHLLADWEHETACLDMDPGDVEPIPLDLPHWPGYACGMQAAADWTRARGLRDVLARTEVDLMTCRGARYHHDATRYGRAAFCNLFLSADKGLDLHFPLTGCRIPLTQGTSVIFDTGQPHAVIRRRSSGFDAADFAPGQDCTLVFLTWELPIEDVHVARALGIAFDVDTEISGRPTEEQLTLNGEPAVVCPDSGRWVRIDRARHLPMDDGRVG
jgi:hypothetical protein